MDATLDHTAFSFAAVVSYGLGCGVRYSERIFRDVGQITGVVLQFWFWLTPIVYTLQALPEGVQKFIKLNPLLPLIKGWQTVFLDHAWPDFTSFSAYDISSAHALARCLAVPWTGGRISG